MTNLAPTPTAPDRAIQPRLLIAEDNEMVGRHLKTSLEADPGVRVDIARDGKQALAALKSEYYSIFLTDLEMPHLDGMQLIHEGVRQVRGNATLQVPGADVCVVSNQGGVMHTHATLILGSA